MSERDVQGEMSRAQPEDGLRYVFAPRSSVCHVRVNDTRQSL